MNTTLFNCLGSKHFQLCFCINFYIFVRLKAKALKTKDISVDTERNIHEKDMTRKGAEAQMSESYHEIFDTMMPPETAKARILAEATSEPGTDDTKETITSCHANKPSSQSR